MGEKLLRRAGHVHFGAAAVAAVAATAWGLLALVLPVSARLLIEPNRAVLLTFGDSLTGVVLCITHAPSRLTSGRV